MHRIAASLHRWDEMTEVEIDWIHNVSPHSHLRFYIWSTQTHRPDQILPSMSSYDPPVDAAGIMTEEEMQRSMKLVRLQIATPLSLLMTIGANLVCALAIKPGLGE